MQNKKKRPSRREREKTAKRTRDMKRRPPVKDEGVPYLRPSDVAKTESAMLLNDFNKMKASQAYRKEWIKRYGKPHDGHLVM